MYFSTTTIIAILAGTALATPAFELGPRQTCATDNCAPVIKLLQDPKVITCVGNSVVGTSVTNLVTCFSSRDDQVTLPKLCECAGCNPAIQAFLNANNACKK